MKDNHIERAYREGYEYGLIKGYELGVEKHKFYHDNKEAFKKEFTEVWLPKIMSPINSPCPYIKGHHEGFAKGLSQAFKDKYHEEYVGHKDYVCNGDICYAKHN